MNIGKYFSRYSSSPVSFSEFDAGNAMLFQIEVVGRKIKETTLVRHFIKVTGHPSFT